uniref:Uncharacterized protein n=1 Tax=Arundo donax TaxID=35708 RepID=A0A0A9A6F4_ARUDO
MLESGFFQLLHNLQYKSFYSCLI